MKHMIIGCGIAGISAAEAIRKKSETDEITIIYNEPHPFYFRAALSFFKKGEISENEVLAKPAGWYKTNKIDLVNENVTSVDADSKTITLENGSSLEFDKLLIASGASPFTPPWEGAELEGVYTYRTLNCAKRFSSEIKTLKLTDAIVVGGGILGIEMTENFVNLGLKVTVLIRESTIAKILFEEEAANIIVEDMTKAGVNFIFNDEIDTIKGDGKRVTEILTKNGQQLKCNIMGIAVGVRSNISFLIESGIKMDRGIIVDEKMKTIKKDIYSAGDCCIMYDSKSESYVPTGTWLKSSIQGEIAGNNMAGEDTAFDNTFFNASHIFRFLYAVIGEYKPSELSNGIKRIVYENSNGTYKNIIFYNNKIIGATFLNNFDGLWDIKKLIDEKTEIDEIDQIFKNKNTVTSFLRDHSPTLFSI